MVIWHADILQVGIRDNKIQKINGQKNICSNQSEKNHFQITTIGNMGIVQESIYNINRICKEVGYENYSVVVVSEVKESLKAQSL